ncbi:PD-(D/E)XK nuclease family protein [Lysinibacillus fusiformis]|uniref:PD-(D/E)XK nuclease family protein n=1 Tax=Lysinibacillus fusiformis TaxID=28031 RepID=UPI002D7689D6|nr:PD-(D/E)XK nuclease family protein [Lysinibacillus fusiformis]WRS96186.1 PD-(D/E)XK nuclease family protein [Lysinibacillus fusiformis]
MFEITPYPTFSWSLSRHKTLTSCARKYGYEYYFSHNGWLSYNVEPYHQLVYRLKKLQPMPILFGQIVHLFIEQAINDYLQTGKPPTLEELIHWARGQLNAAFIDSTRHLESWRQKPNKYYMMQEIYYTGKLPADLVQDYKERIKLVFEHFLMSETFQQITSQRGSLRIGEPEQFRSMKINEIQVFVVMDFHYFNELTDKWVIVDWKTGGESDDDRQQLALYAYYVQQKYRVPLEQIEVYNEYLLTGKRKKYSFSDFDMDNILHTFQYSVLEMKKYQADIFSNEPVELEDFEQTQEKWHCRGCNFRELCAQK